jgi:hypothetical protein
MNNKSKLGYLVVAINLYLMMGLNYMGYMDRKTMFIITGILLIILGIYLKIVQHKKDI